MGQRASLLSRARALPEDLREHVAYVALVEWIRDNAHLGAKHLFAAASRSRLGLRALRDSGALKTISEARADALCDFVRDGGSFVTVALDIPGTPRVTMVQGSVQSLLESTPLDCDEYTVLAVGGKGSVLQYCSGDECSEEIFGRGAQRAALSRLVAVISRPAYVKGRQFVLASGSGADKHLAELYAVTWAELGLRKCAGR